MGGKWGIAWGCEDKGNLKWRFCGYLRRVSLSQRREYKYEIKHLSYKKFLLKSVPSQIMYDKLVWRTCTCCR